MSDQKTKLHLEAMVFPLCCGLSYLHSNNITHGGTYLGHSNCSYEGMTVPLNYSSNGNRTHLHHGNIAFKISSDFLFHGDESIRELETPDLVPILPIPCSLEGSRLPSANKPLPKYLMSNNVFHDYVREVLNNKGALTSAKFQIIDLSNG